MTIPHIIIVTMLIACSIFACGGIARADDLSAKETPQQRDARMAWWTDARFGMFIHWDMSSVAGTEISWSRGGSKPLDVTGDKAGYVEDHAYDHLYQKFNPTKFDAKAWVKIAKNAGMKYLVFTAKHHGGFCMWDTQLTDYSIMHTQFHRDVVKELADTCHEAGMRFGIYYSPRDWHNPDYGIGDNRKYVDYMNGQLRELLTNYGKVDVIWFDSYGTGDLVNFWRIGQTWSLIKSLQPDILINNRLAVLAEYNQQPEPYRGDFDTPEQTVGKFQRARSWESCMCLLEADGGGWSYRPGAPVKSFPSCIQTLVSCATGDGNLLLDAAPNSLGEIPKDQSDRLAEMGQWLKKYGNSIYATHGGPYHNGQWGGSTFKGNTVYLHFFNWKSDSFRLSPLPAKITAARALTGGNLKFEQDESEIRLTLPAAAHDPVDTIIELTLNAPAAGIPVVNVTPAIQGLIQPTMKATASNVFHNSTEYSAGKAIDGNPDTRWATDDGTKQAWLEVDLGKPMTFDRAAINEACGDRVQSFQLQYQDGQNWKSFYEGTTIGEDFITPKCAAVKAQFVRLNILDSTEGPTIAEFQLLAPSQK